MSTTPSTPASTSVGFDVIDNMPPAAKQHTNAGAQAFARHYVHSFGELLRKPSRGQLTRLYLPECGKCANEERIIGSHADKGHYLDAQTFQTKTVSEPDQDASTAPTARLTSLVLGLPTNRRDRAGQLLHKLPDGEEDIVIFKLVWRDSQWLVTYLEEQPFKASK